MAVASIGEVHGARLLPSVMADLAAAGQALESPEVVVKIQLPNIERRFRADIKTIITFCSLAMPQHVPPMEEIQKQFLTEFDYTLEAANLAEVRENVLGSRDRAGQLWDDRVYIPRAAMPLCTKGVLVMERLPGVPMVTGLKKQFNAIAESRGQTLAELEADQKAQIEAGTLKKLRVHRQSYPLHCFAGMCLRDCLRLQELERGRRAVRKLQHDAAMETLRDGPLPALLELLAGPRATAAVGGGGGHGMWPGR